MSSSSSSTDNNKPYHQLYPDFSQYLTEPTETETPAPKNNVTKPDVKEPEVKKSDVKESETLEDKVDAYCREFLYLGGPQR